MAQNEFNPYVGPRPFERKEEDAKRFFGRSQETQEIVSFIFGHPVTLVYAQSGAGKTSLFNASITLNLEKKGFDVLPLTRVGGVVPKEVSLKEIKNLYVFNALLKMDSDTDPREQLTKSLSEFLKMRIRMTDENGQPRPRAIIFDQFEELFTYTPENWREQRKGFFLQVVEALNANPLLRVVFVIREDFLAELDPYARNLPERLRIRYRLERLGENAALHAIKDPLANTPRKFASGVAEGLVRELLTTRTVDATGKMAEIEGQYVEPVQLQVVCVTLWSSLEPDVTEIQQAHLQNFDVSSALSDFYKSAIESAVQEKRVEESVLRNWFGKTLITPMGTRSTVFRGENSTGGIENSSVDFLEMRHIIRAEFRAGARWYELTHDRLVAPIIADNRQWDEKNSSPFRLQAEAWQESGGKDIHLLSDQALVEAERWAGENQAKMIELDTEYLSACREKQNEKEAAIEREARRAREEREREAQQQKLEAAQKLADEQARSARRAWRISLVAITFFVLAIIAAVSAYRDRSLLTIISHSHELSAQAVFLRNRNFPVSLLLGIESFRSLDDAQTSGVLLDNVQANPQLRQFLLKHNDAVTSVTFSPDSKVLASGGSDNTILLRDAATGQPIGKPLEGHKSYVQSVVFSPDGKTLASGSDDNTIILWNMETHQPISKPLQGHNDNVYSIAFSPDGKMLASGSWDDSIILWDVDKRQPIGESLKGHIKDVYCVAFSPDGKILASGSLDNTIILWDVATRQPIAPPLEANNSYVESLAFSPDGKTLASAGFDGTITLWDVLTHQQIVQLKGHTNWVSSVAFSPDGNTLVSASADGSIILWNVATRQPLVRPLTGHSGVVLSVAFSPDGKTLASGGSDKAVILWDASANQPIGQLLTTSTLKINSVAISPNGKMLASGSDDANFTFWDISSRQPIGLPHQDHHQSVEAVTFSPDGKLLASGGFGTGIIVWDFEEKSIRPTLLVGKKDSRFDFTFSLAFSPDGKILASGNWEDTITLWDVTTFQPIGELKGHEQSANGVWLAITSLAFSPDGKILASGSEDKAIILWDVVTQKQFGKRLTGHTGQLYSIAFSPDGQTLASASFDRTIILWDVKTQQPIQQLTGHLSSVQSVAFSPAGKILASGGADRSIILWDVASRQPIGQPLTGHTGSVNSLVFSPDGKTLVSASNEIIVWDLDPQLWVEKSCQRAGRNLTRAEWTQYFPNEEYRVTCAQWPLQLETTTIATP